MHRDIENKYRSILQDDHLFSDRVNTPWDDVPDLPEYNQQAYTRIERAVRSLGKSPVGSNGTNTQGILVLGEAGTGKTHLLMRVARNLSRTNHILFIRKPNNEEAVAQHIWSNIITSLEHPLSTTNTDRSQLDDLLANVLGTLLIKTFEQDIKNKKEVEVRKRWIARLKEDPYRIFQISGEGEQRQQNLTRTRRTLLKFLQDHCPDVDQTISHALISYCLVRRADRKRLLLNWLAGRDIEEAEAKDLGLPVTWVRIDNESSDIATQQQREDLALRAIRTIGILSTYYQPLILAFDQLEGLRGQQTLTERWGDALREIFTMTPNLLVVTCIFPSLWETWFRPRLDHSVVERVAQQTVTLETFAPRHGLQMMGVHMAPSRERHRLPTNIFPFEDHDVATLCENATSPRAFLQGARAAFETWLDGNTVDNIAPELETAQQVASHTHIDDTIRDALAKAELEGRRTVESELLTEQEFFGRVRTLTEAILRPLHETVELSKATYQHYVMPPNIVVRDVATNDAVCLAILNSEGSSVFPRLKNLTACAKEHDQFSRLVILRDRHCRQLGQKSKELLDNLHHDGASVVEAGNDEISRLNAVYETLVAIQEHDLSSGTHIIEDREFVAFLQSERYLSQSEFYRKAAEVSSPLAVAIGNASAEHLETSRDEGPTARKGEVPQPPRSTECTLGAPSTIAMPTSTGVSTVVGDTSFDSPHIGVLGQLVDDRSKLGISLTKPQGIMILGYMGSGKSYALGVLIENALLTQPGLITQSRPMSVVAFNYRRNSNARFEYGGYAVPNDQSSEVMALADEFGGLPAAVNQVNVFGYEPELARRASDYNGLRTYPIQFRPDELGAEHWEILMKPPSKGTEYMDIMRDIIQKLHYQERLSLENLERYIESDERLTPAQVRRAKSRLTFARRWISDSRSYDWTDVLQEGSLNIIDLRMQASESSEALRLCLIITDLVRRAKNGVNKMIVFDEAHEYVDNKELVEELENALTQIRHDGLSFVFASQFPERIPKGLFRYLATRLIFKLPTTEAIKYLQNAAPNLQGLSLKRIADLELEKGVCFFQTDDDCTDRRLRLPSALRIRPRCSRHGGATVRQVVSPAGGIVFGSSEVGISPLGVAGCTD